MSRSLDDKIKFFHLEALGKDPLDEKNFHWFIDNYLTDTFLRGNIIEKIPRYILLSDNYYAPAHAFNEACRSTFDPKTRDGLMRQEDVREAYTKAMEDLEGYREVE